MGLMVHSLEGIPEGHDRDYFIYLLDYGWKEPLGRVLTENFGKMATLASEKKNAVVIMRTDEGIHFSDEVFSWHKINGDEVDRESLLPAILITNRHPAEFKRRASSHNEEGKIESDLKMILFPLKEYCSNTTEVIDLIQQIFIQVKQNKDLNEFDVVKEKKRGKDGAIASSIVVRPSKRGTKFAFSTVKNYFSK